MSRFTLEFPDDPLFALAFHPEKPQFVLGFASGTVSGYDYSNASEPPKRIWTTKRHKSSCRAVCYSQNGHEVYTAGSDNVIKCAKAQNGKVLSKAATGSPTTVMVVNSAFVAVGDEDGHLSAYELGTLSKKYSFDNVHEDAINALVALEHKNQYHFVTAGTSTVAHTDLRKGVLTTSEDQEDEILSGCVSSDAHSVFGMSEGVLTIWNNDHLLDQQSRVRLSKETIDTVVAGKEDDVVIAGASDGNVYEVNVNSGTIVGKRTHGEDSEVQYLDYDYKYQLASASMYDLILWDEEAVKDLPVAPEANPKPSKKRKNKNKSQRPEQAKKPSLFEDL